MFQPLGLKSSKQVIFHDTTCNVLEIAIPAVLHSVTCWVRGMTLKSFRDMDCCVHVMQPEGLYVKHYQSTDSAQSLLYYCWSCAFLLYSSSDFLIKHLCRGTGFLSLPSHLSSFIHESHLTECSEHLIRSRLLSQWKSLQTRYPQE